MVIFTKLSILVSFVFVITEIKKIGKNIFPTFPCLLKPFSIFLKAWWILKLFIFYYCLLLNKDDYENLELLIIVLIDFVTGNLGSASHGYCLNLSQFFLTYLLWLTLLLPVEIEFHFLGTLKGSDTGSGVLNLQVKRVLSHSCYSSCGWSF